MIPRRDFLNATATSTIAGLATSQLLANQAATNPKTVRIGMMGLNRGAAIATEFAKLSNVEVTILCDADRGRAESFQRALYQQSEVKTKVTVDFRDILKDDSIDALVCAAPNHWHGPATILACKAGKHVYVEKPCSHNPLEGELMIAAAAKYGRCVQMGTQRRSGPVMRQAIEKLHSGAIGTVRLSRSYYNNLRGPIGRGKKTTPPPTLDYDLWQGPAPHREFQNNFLHYNWHWFWHWGGGELANNGVHSLDLARWGLQVEFPKRVISLGGRYWFDDDQETPDTQTAVFEFAEEKQIMWSSTSCNKHSVNPFLVFYGDNGSMEVDASGAHRIFDRNDKLIEEASGGSDGMSEHLTNFVSAVRANDPSLLNQPITSGHRSTLLCHLGNIAARSGRTVNCDPSNGHILHDKEQQAYWQREYEPHWRDSILNP